jgi:glycolate oxidase
MDILSSRESVLVHGSQTSTVIPFHLMVQRIQRWALAVSRKTLSLVNLQSLPKQLSIDEEGSLHFHGPVTWKEAELFCQLKGRGLMTYPTETLATLAAGLATSATGERSFGLGTLRDQVLHIEAMNTQGERVNLTKKPMPDTAKQRAYQNDFEPYKPFKNGPFPRFDLETDQLIGTEGQLAVILGGTLQTIPLVPYRYFLVALPPWDEDFSLHVALHRAIQAFRGAVVSCELIDHHCLKLIDQRPTIEGLSACDFVFLECVEGEPSPEDIACSLLSSISDIREDWIFEISQDQFHQIRQSVPRATYENNVRMGVEKKGTDAQVRPDSLPGLFAFFNDAKKCGLPYYCFGHFGDAHLHFNFLPNVSQLPICNAFFAEFYRWIGQQKGSPFAEHGIGLMKQKFIEPFYHSSQRPFFAELKHQWDPRNQLFPMGFMSGPFDPSLFSDDVS